MNNICINCICWTRNNRNQEDYKYDINNFGECNNSAFIYTGEDLELTSVIIDNAFLYCDSEMYGAAFETGQNFGCVHFKSK